jgi:hypothetical protein
MTIFLGEKENRQRQVEESTALGSSRLRVRGEGACFGELAFEKGEEGFAVGAAVQALAAVTGKNGSDRDAVNLIVQLVDVSGGVEKTLCAEEEACSGALVEGETQCAYEGVSRVVVLGGVVVDVAIAAFGAEAVVSGNCFEQRGFSGAVFAGEEDDAGVDFDLRERCNCWNGEGIDAPVFDSFAEEGDLLEHDGIRSEFDPSSIPVRRESGRALPRTIFHRFAKARKDGAPGSWLRFVVAATCKPMSQRRDPSASSGQAMGHPATGGGDGWGREADFSAALLTMRP